MFAVNGMIYSKIKFYLAKEIVPGEKREKAAGRLIKPDQASAAQVRTVYSS